MDCTKFKLISENPDICGEWRKADVLVELKEIGVSSDGLNWIEYILSHFDEIDNSITETICNPNVLRIDFFCEGCKVTAVKS